MPFSETLITSVNRLFADGNDETVFFLLVFFLLLFGDKYDDFLERNNLLLLVTVLFLLIFFMFNQQGIRNEANALSPEALESKEGDEK